MKKHGYKVPDGCEQHMKRLLKHYAAVPSGGIDERSGIGYNENNQRARRFLTRLRAAQAAEGGFHMPEEPEGKLLSLLDEEGKEHEFEHLATVEYNGDSYVALSPVFEKAEELLASDASLVILKIVTDEETGEEVLASLDNEDEFDAVSAEFEKILGDEYDFEAEDQTEN